jgi:hypothetical protein
MSTIGYLLASEEGSTLAPAELRIVISTAADFIIILKKGLYHSQKPFEEIFPN